MCIRQAFDRVNYIKLFKLFIKRHQCSTGARFLANIYTSQYITNGVNQGGVLSSILLYIYIYIYMDELLRTLSLCGAVLVVMLVICIADHSGMQMM